MWQSIKAFLETKRGKFLSFIIITIWMIFMIQIVSNHWKNSQHGFAFQDIRFLYLLDGDLILEDYNQKSEIHSFAKINIHTQKPIDEWIINAKSLLLQHDWKEVQGMKDTLCSPIGVKISFYQNNEFTMNYMTSTRSDCMEVEK